MNSLQDHFHPLHTSYPVTGIRMGTYHDPLVAKSGTETWKTHVRACITEAVEIHPQVKSIPQTHPFKEMLSFHSKS